MDIARSCFGIGGHFAIESTYSRSAVQGIIDRLSVAISIISFMFLYATEIYDKEQKKKKLKNNK
jgi:hypothetical protein